MKLRKMLAPAAILLALAGIAWWTWSSSQPSGPGKDFISGNGRIEATEVDVATRIAGRVEEILVDEGAFVKAGQPLARMQVDSLDAQLDEARAMHQQVLTGVAQAQAQIAARESEKAATQAQVVQRETELDAARRRLARSEALAKEGASSRQGLDDDRASMRSAQAALAATRAQVSAAEAAIEAARATRAGAEAAVKAAAATIERIGADVRDSELRAPRDGRVQFRLAQPGEVLAPGGKVLNLVDLSDVYMTFFLPETVAGRVPLGAEVRVVLDIAPQLAIPARASFVASTAQFTPKTVETASERQKLMFRVRARIDPALLESRLEQVKTGLPGVAWLRLDPNTPWPPELDRLVPVE